MSIPWGLFRQQNRENALLLVLQLPRIPGGVQVSLTNPEVVKSLLLLQILCGEQLRAYTISQMVKSVVWDKFPQVKLLGQRMNVFVMFLGVDKLPSS